MSSPNKEKRTQNNNHHSGAIKKRPAAVSSCALSFHLIDPNLIPYRLNSVCQGRINVLAGLAVSVKNFTVAFSPIVDDIRLKAVQIEINP